jgi:acyl-[acyl carrier protein]--UDP-N-acetylglucosamine O-acyltransferase
LQRRGFAEDIISQLRRAYKLFIAMVTVAKAIEELQLESAEIQALIQFIETSNAGIVR